MQLVNQKAKTEWLNYFDNARILYFNLKSVLLDRKQTANQKICSWIYLFDKLKQASYEIYMRLWLILISK